MRSASRILAVLLAAIVLASCGGGGGGGGGFTSTGPSYSTGSGSAALTTIPAVTGVSNVVPIYLDSQWSSVTSLMINVPYVSVTVCTPGTSGTAVACQTIDHIQLDTGSYGLRILKSALSSSLTLPGVSDGSGAAIGNCGVFADGYTWGSLRRADVYLNGELASNVSIQDIGDSPGLAPSAPSDCISAGNGHGENTVTALGANGRLGIGPFINDCDVCIGSVQPGTYYTCTASGCSGSSVTNAQVLKNPVALFALNNNGTKIVMPTVSNSGTSSAGQLTFGSLTFGIGTQNNNLLGSAVVYPLNIFTTHIAQSGDLNTNYQGTDRFAFIDSGSNALFFPDSSNIATCTRSTGFYCPTTTYSNSATVIGWGGSPSGNVSFSVINIDTLLNGNGQIQAANVAGPTVGGFTSAKFDWGLPFFFGKSVFTGIYGMTPPSGIASVPYVAF
jgi:hypothetical protein